MSIYQRCLSKSLIFFSIFFVIFLLFIETNIGFKWIFNFTSRFFIGFKAEEISGNWRDFTLKKIKYNVFGISMTANSIHVVLDTRSLFKMSTIFKEIETKNLMISLKRNTSSDFLKRNTSSDFLKRNIFIKYPVIFQKIHVDKISFNSSKVHMFFLNVLSGIELINNNIIFSPTCIDTIYLSSSKFNHKKKNILNKLNYTKNFNYSKKIYSFLNFFSNRTKIFIPLNINLISLKCKKIRFIDYKKNNVFQIELKAQIENSILKVKKIQIDSSFLKIKSYGKIFFNDNYSFSCFIKNRIVIPRFHNRIINVSFKATLNSHNKFIFKLKSKDLYKMKCSGSILLNSSDYPFFIKLQSRNLCWSIKKDYVFKLNSFNGILKGKINNYFLSLKNVFTLQGLPSVFINIEGAGNLKNIFLNNIKFFPIEKKKFYKEKINLKDNIQYNQNILELIGKINVAGKSNITDSLSISNINLDGKIVRKKFSILGSIYYKKFNFIKIPEIQLFLGKNKLFLNGSLGEKYNIHSSFYANNLDYFFPDLKGRIKAKANFSGSCMFPIITSKILASNLNWNNTYVKNIKILTKISANDFFAGKISLDAKKIHFYNFNINKLHIQTYSNNYKQNFSFLFKSHGLYINLMINGIFNKQTGNWDGFFKKINICTIWGKITAPKNNLINYYDSNNSIRNFYQKTIKKKENFLSYLYNTKTYFYNICNQPLINFKSELSIQAKLKWILGEKISDGKIFLTGNNITLEKKINQKVFIENIDSFKISINLIKNNFKSKWIVKKINNERINGYLNIIDVYNKKNIQGKFAIYHFPFSFINFFTTNFKQVNGFFQSQIKVFGTFYQPKISADVSFKNIFIKSDDILQYITLFFPYFLGKVDTIKINQEIIMKKGNVLFTLNPNFKNSNNMEWNLLFNSTKISVLIFPGIQVKFSSQLNLHYLLSKYDLIGYIKFALFYFKINEKNFIF